MIEAVLFDYGGVLSTGGRPGTLYNVVAAHFGVPRDELDLDKFHDQLRRDEICSQDFFDAMNTRYSAEEPLTIDHYLAGADYIQRHAKIVYQLAQAIRSGGVATGILSNVYRMSARELNRLGRYDGFDPVLLSCDEHMAKPDPEFFQLAIDRVGVEPQRILMVDDQERNLAPARSLGMMVVQSVEPEQVVRDVTELFRRQNHTEITLVA